MTFGLARAVLVVVCLASVAVADPKADAKVHIDKATQHHAAGRFADALVELEAAFALHPDPGLHYAIAQVQVKLDRCADAIGHYEKFIASNPGDKPTKAANEAIATCKTRLAAEPEPEPIPEPKPAPPPAPEIKPDPTPDPPRPVAERAWYADPLGGALVGAGVIGGVIGVVLYRGASADIDEAEAAENYGRSEELVAGAKTKRRNATIAGIAGGALVIGGIVRYVTSGKRETRAVAVVPTGDGAAVTWSGRW